MMALYLAFILAGAALFAFVYFYSIRAQRVKRAKLDQKLDRMVVDEMLKPSKATPAPKPQKIEKSTVKPEHVNPDVARVPILEGDAVQSPPERTVLKDNVAVDTNEFASSQADRKLVEHQQPKPMAEPTLQSTAAQSTSSQVAVQQGVDEMNRESDAQNQVSLFEQSDAANSVEQMSADTDSVPLSPTAKPVSVAGKIAAAKLSWDERECELVAKILGDGAVSRDEILAIFRKYDFLLARKLHVFGFNTLTQMWSDVEREDVSAVFTDLGVSVQLADKSGALTRKELNTVSQLVLEYAESFNRQFSFSMDLDEAIEIGRELDELGRRHSSMVVLNIVPKRKDGFRSSDIDSCTRDLNMSQSETGVFTRYRRNHNRSSVLYHVAVADENGNFQPVKKQAPFRIHDIVVYLNVPTVEHPADAFANMVDEARKLATWLDGKLVDKHRRNMTTKGVNLLKDQVAEIEQNMLMDGISPGGALSHKLF